MALELLLSSFEVRGTRLRNRIVSTPHATGWDGCEVTSFGGHLIEQFFDPAVNTRSDRYGGTLENRTRFARELLEAVRAAVSERFIVGFRMTVDQRLEGGPGPGELRG